MSSLSHSLLSFSPPHPNLPSFSVNTPFKKKPVCHIPFSLLLSFDSLPVKLPLSHIDVSITCPLLTLPLTQSPIIPSLSFYSVI